MKSEIRISKSETNSNDQNSNGQNKKGWLRRHAHWLILILNFDIVLSFGFRISNFAPKLVPCDLANAIHDNLGGALRTEVLDMSESILSENVNLIRILR